MKDEKVLDVILEEMRGIKKDIQYLRVSLHKNNILTVSIAVVVLCMLVFGYFFYKNDEAHLTINQSIKNDTAIDDKVENSLNNKSSSSYSSTNKKGFINK